MGLLSLSIRRPVAVSMFFLAVIMVGAVAWQRLPVELFPALTGNSLFVTFTRPGSTPQVIEREILLPLQARVAGLPLVTETFAEIRGSSGRYEVRFEPGADVDVNTLELQRIGAELQRAQPRGTFINVSSVDTSIISSFAMIVHVLGGQAGDRNAIHDLARELVAPRFAAVSGVSQAITTGGAPRQVTVTVDPDRAAALGMTSDGVIQSVRRNVDRLKYLGAIESGNGRMPVVLDGRPRGLHSLGEARIRTDNPARLHDVSDVRYGAGREEALFRVNGQPAVGLVIFREQGTNLVRLGRQLRERVAEVREDLQPLGLDLVIGFDGAGLVEEQIDRLASLGATGFAISLVVLFMFLREWRAVTVVGVAVPVSLLAALAMLYLAGESLNLITVFGLALAIGLLVDNSIVVYEAVQRRLERGATATAAVRDGLRRTVRAIAAATVTMSVVFLPATLIEFEDELTRELIGVVALSIVLPLAASLLVAVGLVPLLAERLAAPAATRRIAGARKRRAERGGLVAPDRARMLFGGVLATALRRPSGWIAGTTAAVLGTMIVAVPWVTVQSAISEAPEAETVQLDVRFASGQNSLEAISSAVGRVERAVLDLEGVDRIEATIQENGGSLTIQLADASDRPADLSARTIRATVRRVADQIQGLQVLRPGEGQGGNGQEGGAAGGQGGVGGLLGGTPSEVVLSGPDSELLQGLAEEIRARLDSMPQVTQAWMSTRPGLDEIWVEPNRGAFEAFGLTLDQVFPVLQLAGREGERMQTGFLLPNGRELPLVVERRNARRQRGSSTDLTRLRLQTEAGVVPVMALASMRRMPPPPLIVHHNGRRELKVLYRLSSDVASTGPNRVALEEQIAEAVRSVPRPNGFTVEISGAAETTSWFRRIVIPVVLLMFLVLAITFESLTLPALVLLALPLTVLGAVWALVFAGMPLDMMAMLGALALFGLTVNPAILLVDRMQQLVRAGRHSGAAALAAVRERTRPVLMTMATTVAGLWPLALTTGRENEIWPPFATIVIGGLVTSTLLTLLIIPVGFILLRELDRIFGRVGPWLVLVWLGGTIAAMIAFIASGLVTSLFWQTVLGFLVGGGLLAVVVLVFRRRELPEPDRTSGPPALRVRSLRKVYGLPGPVRAAIRASTDFAQRVLAHGGRAFDPADARARIGPLAVGAASLVYLGTLFQGEFWTLVAWMLASALVARLTLEIRRARGKADPVGRVEPGGIEGWIAVLVPWAAIATFTWWALPAGARPFDRQDLDEYLLSAVAALALAFGQAVRRSARRQSSGELPRRVSHGALRHPRSLWRRWASRVGGLDLPVDPVRALAGVTFSVERGMVGVLGPNGAGKTTLLRQLAGVLDPTRGTIGLGGVPLRRIQRYLAHWVGYLPQDAGLPGGMTAREYLSYFAALYDLPRAIRQERVQTLLEEVGLIEKADEPIKALSGGMRQRVAVARTLLRLPPVIIVDEPTVGLDPRERIRFRNLLSRLGRDRIVLFSTHVVEDVAVACERVLVLARGRLVFDGEPRALADAARGRVWEVRATPNTEIQLPPGAIRAEATPAADGSVVHRILASERPGETARPLDAALEDGYLWLLHHAPAGASA